MIRALLINFISFGKNLRLKILEAPQGFFEKYMVRPEAASYSDGMFDWPNGIWEIYFENTNLPEMLVVVSDPSEITELEVNKFLREEGFKF